jgi:hypothetical protein
MPNYDYKLMAVAVCNGEYSKENIDLAMSFLKHFGCHQIAADAIRIWLEALGATDAQVKLTIL